MKDRYRIECYRSLDLRNAVNCETVSEKNQPQAEGEFDLRLKTAITVKHNDRRARL